jgi:hypothetical protein
MPTEYGVAGVSIGPFLLDQVTEGSAVGAFDADTGVQAVQGHEGFASLVQV